MNIFTCDTQPELLYKAHLKDAINFIVKHRHVYKGAVVLLYSTGIVEPRIWQEHTTRSILNVWFYNVTGICAIKSSYNLSLSMSNSMHIEIPIRNKYGSWRTLYLYVNNKQKCYNNKVWYKSKIRKIAKILHLNSSINKRTQKNYRFQ